MQRFQAEKGTASGKEGKRSLGQAYGEGQSTVRSQTINALCFPAPEETATTTTTATGTSTLHPTDSAFQAHTQTWIRPLFLGEKDRAASWQGWASATGNKNHGVGNETATNANYDIAGWQSLEPYGAQGYHDRWNDYRRCQSDRQQTIRLSGHSSATLHYLWTKKEKCTSFVNKTYENAKEMVVKRQGPWPRPPPPAQNVTSNCMTCGLLMRYPSDVGLFRCTICATVNELGTLTEKTAERALKREEILKSKDKAKKKEEPPIPPFKPLSVAFTKHTIEDCIRTYLIAKFCTEQTAGIVQFPGPSEQVGDSEPPPYSKEDPSLAALDDTHYEPKYHFSAEPTLRRDFHKLDISANKFSMSPPGLGDPGPSRRAQPPAGRRKMYFEEDPSRIFRPARDYITQCFSSAENINHSFLTETAAKPIAPAERRSSAQPSRTLEPSSEIKTASESEICGVDPKLLLLGDVAKNGSWWLGGHSKGQPSSATTRKEAAKEALPQPEKTPSLNFAEIEEWYNIVANAAGSWGAVWSEVRSRPNCASPTAEELKRAQKDVSGASVQLRNRLMKLTEELLTKRVGGRLTRPEELRFLLFILQNPLLDGDTDLENNEVEGTKNWPSNGGSAKRPVPPSQQPGPMMGRHSRILKRVIGLIANCPIELHHHLISWFANYDRARFIRVKDIVSGFLTYRLIRQDKAAQAPADTMNNLIPSLRPGDNIGSLHDAIRQGSAVKQNFNAYCSDWQVKCTSQVLAILFEANNPQSSRHALAPSPAGWKPSLAQGLFLPMSDFYVSMIDYVDLVADFEEFGKKGGKFAFCHYPFLMSVWAKTQVLDFDSKRQMKETARDAFFDNLLRHTQTQQTLTLDVRRDCLADDSLKAIASTMGSVSNESKKALRIKFRGEEGIDGGGLRKEWFLLLVREVFNPGLGLFEYDEDSQYCYFNPHTLDGGDQFYLVGVILGLAIYNSTILDVPLPPFVFRKLVSMSPSRIQTNSLTQIRPHTSYTLGDLAQYRPRLARGLKQLLDFDGDVEQTFMRTFVVEAERYGNRYEVPLCKDGERTPVTNRNRREFVDLYVRHILDVSVARQFEPFKRGFYQVCSGSAFGLFRPEEVELLVRGSDEPLDVTTLRGVAEYDEWGVRRPDDAVDQVNWFWELFIHAAPQDQRKLLLFITGSDRVPAAGASMMPLRISCLGDDCDRLPVARTCFNKLSLWRYANKEKMGRLLWLAVHESEGFGLQ